MRYLHYCIALITLLLSNIDLSAQTGWRWGLTSENTGLTNGEIAGTVAVDQSGNYYTVITQVGADSITLGSYTIPNPTHGSLSVLAKVDSGGHYAWAYKVPNATRNVIVDQQGDVYTMGIYNTPALTVGSYTLTNSSSGYMLYMAKYTTAGALKWAKNIGTSGYTITMTIGYSNNIYISGTFNAPSITLGSTTLYNDDTLSIQDIFYARLDTAGNVLWAKRLGGNWGEFTAADPMLSGIPLAVTPKGDFYLSGLSFSDTFTVGSTTMVRSGDKAIPFLGHFDPNGNNIWTKRLDSTIRIHSMVADIWGNCYATGTIDSTTVIDAFTLPWSRGQDLLVARFNPDGNCAWAKSTGDTSYPRGQGITVDHCGNVWVAGGFIKSVDLSGHILTASPFSVYPLFLVQYDTAGNYKSSQTLPTSGEDATPLAVDNRGNLYLGGDYYHNPPAADLVLGSDTLSYTYSYEHILIAKYRYDSVRCPTLDVPYIATAEDMTLYPNPVTHTLHISSSAVISSIVITDPFGKTVLSEKCSKKEIEVNMANLNPGVYLARINGVIVRKFVKQ